MQKCRNMVSNQPNALRAPVCDTLRNKPRCLKRLLTFIEILLNGIFCSRVALIAIKTKQKHPLNKDFLFVRQSTKTSMFGFDYSLSVERKHYNGGMGGKEKKKQKKTRKEKI